MAPKPKTSPSAGPHYCPRCQLEQRDDLASLLCRECGESLISQGYCPVCEGHWLLAVGELCPKHDVALEAAPTSPSESIPRGQSISWTTMMVFPDSLAAAVPRTRLEAEGIPTFLEGERMGGLGMYNVATRGVKLQGPASRAADARIILSQDWSLPLPSDEKADFEDLV
jgi:hypothetical protein